MRLARKLMAAVILAMIVVLAIHGYHRAQREAMLLDREGRRDHQLIGRALGLGMAEAWRRGQGPALALVEAMNQREPEIDMRWVWLDAPKGDRFHPQAPSSVLAPLSRGQEVTWLRHPPGRG